MFQITTTATTKIIFLIILLNLTLTSALFEFHEATKQNFRKFQNQQEWKIRKPFEHNDLTRIIEDVSISSTERYNNVRRILEERIRPIPDEIKSEFLHPDNLSFLNVFPELKLTHEDFRLINHREGYALRRASDYGYTQIVKLLLAYKAVPCFIDAEGLRLAAQNGHFNIVKMFYVAGCRTDSRQEYALRAASSLGHTEIVDFLLSVGADPLIKDGFSLLCSTDEEIKNKLQAASLDQMSEAAREKWESEARFGKYGNSYCREFEYCHLQFAGTTSSKYGVWTTLWFLCFVVIFR